MSEHELSARQRWGHIIDQQRASGLSVAVFCRQRALPVSSLYAWKRRFSQETVDHGFVEAKITPIPAAAEGAGVIEVCLPGGRRLRVGRGFDPDLLGELIAAMEGLPS